MTTVDDASAAGEVAVRKAGDLPLPTAALQPRSPRTLILADYIQETFLRLLRTDEDFRKLSNATTNKTSIEGKTILDDGERAGMLREEMGEGSLVRDKNKAEIIKAMRVVEKRWLDENGVDLRRESRRAAAALAGLDDDDDDEDDDE